MKNKFTKNISIHTPHWVESFLSQQNTTLPTQKERMTFVIELSRLNVERGTGGPFAAAVFNISDGTLISAAVNMVQSSKLSVAHAEIVALMQAQLILGSFDLGAAGMPLCSLVTSTAPCAMCLGAIPWSGIKSLVCGARDEDARSVGFDEGAKYGDWIEQLEKRGIEVSVDVLREKAAEVIKNYALKGGVIYNGRSMI